MAEFTRRAVLQTAAAFGGYIALGSFAVAQRSDGAAQYRFFLPEEAAFIEAAVDRLIPPEPEWPGGRDAGVANYIDLQLAGPYGEGDRLFLGGPIRRGTPQQGYQLGLTPAEVYRQSLAALLERGRSEGRMFAEAPPEAQDRMLQHLEAGGEDLNGVPSAVFFETLLANTIEGYFSDPAYGGNIGMAGWRMVGFPGSYAAYLGIYTQHGIAFNQEPLSMMDAQRVHGTTAPARAGSPAHSHR